MARKQSPPDPPEFPVAEMRGLITMAEDNDLSYGCGIREQYLKPMLEHFFGMVAALEDGRLISRKDYEKMRKVSQEIPGMGMIRPQKRDAAQGIANAGKDYAMNPPIPKAKGSGVQPIIKAPMPSKRGR